MLAALPAKAVALLEALAHVRICLPERPTPPRPTFASARANATEWAYARKSMAPRALQAPNASVAIVSTAFVATRLAPPTAELATSQDRSGLVRTCLWATTTECARAQRVRATALDPAEAKTEPLVRWAAAVSAASASTDSAAIPPVRVRANRVPWLQRDPRMARVQIFLPTRIQTMNAWPIATVLACAVPDCLVTLQKCGARHFVASRFTILP